jgi:hypothetical protein
MGQPPFGSSLQIDEPEILMLNFSSQGHESPAPGKEDQMSGPPSQSQSLQRVRCGLGRDCFHRKCGADVGSGVDNNASVGRPRRIDRVFPSEKSGGATMDRHAEEMWDAAIVDR